MNSVLLTTPYLTLCAALVVVIIIFEILNRSTKYLLTFVAAALAAFSLAGHLEDLRRLRDAAAAKGLLNAAVNAEIARGRAAGLYDRKLPAALPDVHVLDFGSGREGE